MEDTIKTGIAIYIFERHKKLLYRENKIKEFLH